MTTNTILPKILVVDDEPIMRASTGDLLETYEYSCTFAENGQQALNLLNEQTFDILLLDLMMPQMSGHQVLQIVTKKYPDLEVIILSGDTRFNSATKALKLGAKDYISKPYKPEALINSIRHIKETLLLKKQIKQMHQQVINSEQRYRFFINHSPDLIYILDKKGRFSFVNERITELLGYLPQELIGKPYSHIVDQDFLPQLKHTLSQNEQFPEIKQSFEFKLMDKDPNKPLRCFESDTIVMNMVLSDFLEQDAKLAITKNKQKDEQIAEQIFSGIYGVARDITDKKDFAKKLSFQLYYDALTSLPNRVLFKDRMNYAILQAKRNNSKFAVISMDINRFKTINDSLGHAIGDILLQLIGTRINSIIRESDTFARIGGDDFLLLLPELSSIKDIKLIIKKINQISEKPFLVEANEIYADFSTGIAIFPEHGNNADKLIKNAEMAMYKSKATQNSSYEFFSVNLISQFESHLSIENGIRKAISDNQFEVYFQPQFNINKQKISGVEALIRWNHPEKGMIMPDSFIHIAEESNLICDIGNWMLDSSMKILQQWNKNSKLQEMTLAINISASQFAQEEFIDTVLGIMAKYSISGNQIELEITENVMLDNIQQVVSKLKQLGRHGIRFAIDDFGMGYSSLSYLQELPLNNLKIDRSFISSIQSKEDNNSIITAIVAMAKDMGMEIVAEGVENDIQLDYIKSLGCPIVQGYYFAKPMNAIDAQNYALSHIN